MQGSGWISVLGRIPVQKHDCLIIVTTTGAEIILREVVRVENDFLVLRGRMAGSTDAGRVIILPFDQVTYFAFNKLIPEPEIQEMFGKSTPTVQWTSVSATAAETGPSPSPSPSPTAIEAVIPQFAAPREPLAPMAGAQATGAHRSGEEGPTAPAAGKGPAKPAHPSKSLLLARLRARLANDGGPLPR